MRCINDDWQLDTFRKEVWREIWDWSFNGTSCCGPSYFLAKTKKSSTVIISIRFLVYFLFMTQNRIIISNILRKAWKYASDRIDFSILDTFFIMFIIARLDSDAIIHFIFNFKFWHRILRVQSGLGFPVSLRTLYCV